MCQGLDEADDAMEDFSFSEISVEELKEIYLDKHRKNMERW